MNGFHYLPVNAAALRGGCYCTSVGSHRHRPKQGYPVSGHPPEFSFEWKQGRILADFALVLIVDGEGEWQVRGENTVRVAGGDALFVVSGQWHRYRASPAKGWAEKWVCLRGSVVHGFVRAGILPASSRVISGCVDSALKARMDRIQSDVSDRPGENLPSWGARALAILLECCSDSMAPASALSGLEPQLQKALRHIEDHCHRPLRVAEIATQCGFGQRTFERRFAAAGLGSVGDYLIRHRVTRAQILLLETQMTVKEIAYTCGFGGTQRMIYDFRMCCGTTPGRWRESQQSPA